jgi:hypothetical protein
MSGFWSTFRDQTDPVSVAEQATIRDMTTRADLSQSGHLVLMAGFSGATRHLTCLRVAVGRFDTAGLQWWGWQASNLGPDGYEPPALTG